MAFLANTLGTIGAGLSEIGGATGGATTLGGLVKGIGTLNSAFGGTNGQGNMPNQNNIDMMKSFIDLIKKQNANQTAMQNVQQKPITRYDDPNAWNIKLFD